jgi:hypothetical protein
LNTRSRKFDVPLLDEIAQLKQ